MRYRNPYTGNWGGRLSHRGLAGPEEEYFSFSLTGAEILAAAKSTDRDLLISERPQHLYNGETLPFVLSEDSHGLYSTSPTLHEASDYRLCPIVSIILHSIENGDIYTTYCIPGKVKRADAFKKRNISMFQKQNQVINEGTLGEEMLIDGNRTEFFHE